MDNSSNEAGALSPYRVLDLSDGALALAGKLFADLGADVIKVERPGGDVSRNIGPFYKDVPDPERSLFWWAYNVNKRGITLDIETRDGQALFKQLVKKADFIIESFAPGHLDEIGLGYKVLQKLNPRVILISISPYGQTGPKSAYPWSDLTAWASCGAAYITGDTDRPPVAMGFIPQICAQASSEALTAALIAHWEREKTGHGEHIDESIQESGIGLLQSTIEFWDLAKMDYKRSGGSWLTTSGAARKLVFKCKDGYTVFLQGGGGSVRMVQASQSLVKWMAEDGMAPEWLQKFDWVNEYNTDTLTNETLSRIEPPFERFLLTKTKEELFSEGWKRGLMIAPVNNIRDIATDGQHAARNFWIEVEHPELSANVTYCGPFARFSVTPVITRRRPPLIGEHNHEIYIDEMGLTSDKLVVLKSAGAI